MKTLLRYFILWMVVCLVNSSCVQYKYVLKNDPQNPSSEVEEAYKEVEPGDWVTVVVNSRTFNHLEVTDIDSQKMNVRQYITADTWKSHTVYLEYIDKLIVEDLEMTYPIGAPFTAVLVILFLLV